MAGTTNKRENDQMEKRERPRCCIVLTICMKRIVMYSVCHFFIFILLLAWSPMAIVTTNLHVYQTVQISFHFHFKYYLLSQLDVCAHMVEKKTVTERFQCCNCEINWCSLSSSKNSGWKETPRQSINFILISQYKNVGKQNNKYWYRQTNKWMARMIYSNVNINLHQSFSQWKCR